MERKKNRIEARTKFEIKKLNLSWKFSERIKKLSLWTEKEVKMHVKWKAEKSEIYNSLSLYLVSNCITRWFSLLSVFEITFQSKWMIKSSSKSIYNFNVSSNQKDNFIYLFIF